MLACTPLAASLAFEARSLSSTSLAVLLMLSPADSAASSTLEGASSMALSPSSAISLNKAAFDTGCYKPKEA